MLHPFIERGAQERNMRADTENVFGIAGLGKALQLSVAHMEENRQHILELKHYMIKRLQDEISGNEFNGDTDDAGSNYNVLNVSTPPNEKSDLLLFNDLSKRPVASFGTLFRS